MNKKDIIIYNFNIGSWYEDFNSEEAILCFKQLVDNPCKMLSNKYNIKSEVEYMSFILPHISKLFKINKNKLRNQWIENVGYYKCFGKNKNKLRD